MSMQDVYNSVFSTFHSVREYLAPVLKNSKFKETGCVTPEEFVAAGDFLVYKCPTWSWESGEPGKRRDYLAADKQFLITRNVPCLRRVKQMEYNDDDAETQLNDADDLEGEDAWMYTHSSRVSRTIDEITRNIDDDDADNPVPELERLGLQSVPAPAVEDEESVPEDIPSMDEIPDMDEEDGGFVEEEDPVSLERVQPKDGDAVITTRPPLRPFPETLLGRLFSEKKKKKK
ncbi:autophagocytosis associated protein, partial [Jimgerdemannia flammicorona]